MKPTAAHKLKRGDTVSINGFWLEIVRIEETFHTPPKRMLLFLNGKSVLVDKDEELLKDTGE